MSLAEKHPRFEIDNLPGKAGKRLFDEEKFNALAAPAVAVPPNDIVHSFHAIFTTFHTLISNERRFRQFAEEPDWDHSLTQEFFTAGRILQ